MLMAVSSARRSFSVSLCTSHTMAFKSIERVYELRGEWGMCTNTNVESLMKSEMANPRSSVRALWIRVEERADFCNTHNRPDQFQHILCSLTQKPTRWVTARNKHRNISARHFSLGISLRSSMCSWRYFLFTSRGITNINCQLTHCSAVHSQVRIVFGCVHLNWVLITWNIASHSRAIGGITFAGEITSDKKKRSRRISEQADFSRFKAVLFIFRPTIS